MFEHSLIDLEERPRSGRRWISFPVAVFLHAVAFGAVALVSSWSVGAVAEADLMEAYAIQLQLPEPKEEPVRPQAAPQPPATPDSQAAPQRPPQPPQIVQPGPEIPDVIPNASDLPSTPNEEVRPGPVAPAPCPGCDGTDPNAKGGADSDGEGDGPVVLRAGMKPPVVRTKVEPRYTEAARKVGLQGVVIVEAVVDERGRVADVRVLRGLPLGLEESAVAAVRQWRFDPATTLDGRPIKVYYSLTINFRVLR